MDFVLAKIQYNPECFSEIIDDFEDFVKRVKPENFQEIFNDLEKTPKWPEEALYCKNLKRALAELK